MPVEQKKHHSGLFVPSGGRHCPTAGSYGLGASGIAGMVLLGRGASGIAGIELFGRGASGIAGIVLLKVPAMDIA
jgi:hypothetical protein